MSINIQHSKEYGENKIIYLSDGSKLIFISTENIPRLVSLFQEKLKKEKERKISLKKNIIIKSIVCCVGTALGVSLCYGTSRVSDKTLSIVLPIISGVLTVTGTLVAFFIPDFINRRINKFINSINGYAIARDDDFNFKYLNNYKYNFPQSTGIGYCEIYQHEKNYEGLVSVLESVSPDPLNRSKHSKYLKYKYDSAWNEEKYDPCFTDDNEGIIVYSSHNECFGHSGEVKINIYKQGNGYKRNDFSIGNCMLISTLDSDILTKIRDSTRFTKEIVNFDEKLIEEITILD